jgi:hypothetical protein
MLMNSFGHPGVLLNRNELQKKVASWPVLTILFLAPINSSSVG